MIDGTLGGDFDRTDKAEIHTRVKDAEENARDEVWGDFRFVVIADNTERNGLKTIDLGAGHSSGSESLCGRVIIALKSQALLNESVGAGYIERNWPPALKESGAWPLASLRQSFLNGSLTRLIDPDTILKGKIVEFVVRGDLGLASGKKTEGTYERIWFEESVGTEEVSFEQDVFLLTKKKAQGLKKPPEAPAVTQPSTEAPPDSQSVVEPAKPADASISAAGRMFCIAGNIPPEIWNRLGTRILPKLRSGTDLKIGINFSVTIDASSAKHFEMELCQILQDLELDGKVQIS